MGGVPGLLEGAREVFGALPARDLDVDRGAPHAQRHRLGEPTPPPPELGDSGYGEVADSGNGVSAVLLLGEWLLIKPELTVHVRHPPRGAWIRLDAATSISHGGAGLAMSTHSDDDAVVAHGAQSLLVAPRPQGSDP
jgi:hypothetical protein